MNNTQFNKANLVPRFFSENKNIWLMPSIAILLVFIIDYFFQNYSSCLDSIYPMSDEKLAIEHGISLALLNYFGYWLFIRFINKSISYLKSTQLFLANPTLNLVLPFFLTILKAIVLLILFNVFIQNLDLPKNFSYFFEKLSSVLIISSFSFGLFKLIDVIEGLLRLKYTANSEGNLSARKVFTQTLILKRIAYGIIAVLTVGAILILFDNVRALGASVLTTAGVAGLVLTFTAQRSLANIFAGLEIALTQPIKIGDVVVIENETGVVEEINFRSVVIKLYNWRRLIIPTNYFLEKSFQNLSRVQNSNLKNDIFIHVDFSLPVKVLRSYFESILKTSTLWDGKIGTLKVSALEEPAMQLKITVSAANYDDVCALSDFIREELITYIAENHPEALPKTRH